MFTFNDIGIRPIEERDLPLMVKLRGEPSVWMKLGNIELIGLSAQKRWFDKLLDNSKVRYYILFSSDIDFIGIVRMDEIDYVNRSIRVGGDILPEYQGHGYGKQMFRLLEKYCFDFLNMHRMWLLVIETNKVALRLYSSVGFKEEGRQREAIFRDGNYVDYIMMSLLKSDYKLKG